MMTWTVAFTMAWKEPIPPASVQKQRGGVRKRQQIEGYKVISVNTPGFISICK